MHTSLTLAASVALLGALASPAAYPQQAGAESGEVAPPPNLPPIALFDAVKRATGIKVFGLTQIGYSTNDVSRHDQATAGHSNFPVVGPADEGLQFNAFQLVAQRQMRSNILPRISPLPGPMPQDFSWGFRSELIYGRNGLPAEMQGIETNWGIDRNPAGSVPGTTRQNYLASPQLYAELYIPAWQGMALTIGRFATGIGREIPPEWNPGPNFFYSKTYAFVSQPDQITGGLLSINLMRNGMGLVAGEAGIAQGRQSFQDNNRQKSGFGALRWRSPDMQTSIDYSFIVGDEQNAPGSAPQLPVARVVSPRGQLRQHHSVSFQAHPADRWEIVGEIVYGRQDGDGRPDTVDVLTGPGYRGGRYAGVNGELRYRVFAPLRVAVRAETFVDRSGTALFPVTSVPSDFHAVTIGARYDIGRNVVVRPELRHDWQSHSHGIDAFGGGTASHQTTLSADVVLSF